jgi:hypothetical protein
MSDIYAVGTNGMVIHYNGSVWEEVDLGVDGLEFYSVWGSSASDVFIGGERGAVFHYDGTSWEAMITSSSGRFAGICGNSATDVYAAVDAYIYHYDGTTWSYIDHRTGYPGFQAIHCSGPGNIIAAGYYGAVLRYGN